MPQPSPRFSSKNTKHVKGHGIVLLPRTNPVGVYSPKRDHSIAQADWKNAWKARSGN